MNTDSLEVEYIKHFPNDAIDGYMLHKDAIYNKGKIFFVPYFFSDYLSVYEIKNNSFQTIKINRRYYDSINCSFVLNDYLYLIPGYTDMPQFKVDMESLEISEINNSECDNDIKGGFRFISTDSMLNCHIFI